MVYFFGGGYLVGGSQGANFLDNYLYSGEEIADRGNVIVVTVNYRVGALGFLSTGDSDLPGENRKLDFIYYMVIYFYTTGTFYYVYSSVFICFLLCQEFNISVLKTYFEKPELVCFLKIMS